MDKTTIEKFLKWLSEHFDVEDMNLYELEYGEEWSVDNVINEYNDCTHKEELTHLLRWFLGNYEIEEGKIQDIDSKTVIELSRVINDYVYYEKRGK